ncbi:DNA-binding transcriptional response regulator, NtrC family, contains REC, AAA-type ATPase, and a Fis-type DNA-binding domains [Andreprevotia lacus DSM 23236]|uniref:DNA-binding transcriptional response regulator, NtrC family, contains REC, AAA-type ATPase, and a Fis-type DNA-binding domains n=1 Tax=Andreprevotia lacus DSM 23236 TaxID=1121001 RepID=A0A1W1XXM5_9NEIS|nr:sigma-54 dependent transcriptional regulator [Andreprevotia lacus]SMC28719.1 DNA-binding transcriptional response regulator, NtrC family, contains REC, AAA-type ATPase, and a Fis-type DNA-binding domains [Andreprevotia lacus DSM 23236]
MGSQDILVVDDEIGIRELLSEILQDEGYSVALAENAETARKLRNQAQPRLVLLDIWMPDTDGVTLLKEWARNGQLTMPVIMMSGHATIDTAVEATRIGAMDFLEKPIGLQKLLAAVKRALTQQPDLQKVVANLARLGEAELIRELARVLDAAKQQGTPVMLLGEPGVGFEICARYLGGSNVPFIAPLSNDDIAVAPQELVNKASGGVLFLRDIAYLDRRAQAGLKNVLPKLDKARVKLVSASSKPLDALASGMDPELLHQLSQLIVPVPSLREHRDDIPPLAEAMLAEIVNSNKLGPRRFSLGALQLLAQQDWPGNIDELVNVVKSLALTSRDGEIDTAPVSRILSQFAPSGEAPITTSSNPAPLPMVDFALPLREARDQFEKYYLELHIEQTGGNMSRVAEKIGLERTHLYRKLKSLGIQVPKKNRGNDEE